MTSEKYKTFKNYDSHHTLFTGRASKLKPVRAAKMEDYLTWETLLATVWPTKRAVGALQCVSFG